MHCWYLQDLTLLWNLLEWVQFTLNTNYPRGEQALWWLHIRGGCTSFIRADKKLVSVCDMNDQATPLSVNQCPLKVVQITFYPRQKKKYLTLYFPVQNICYLQDWSWKVCWQLCSFTESPGPPLNNFTPKLSFGGIDLLPSVPLRLRLKAHLLIFFSLFRCSWCSNRNKDFTVVAL